jgi:hypothetical protein
MPALLETLLAALLCAGVAVLPPWWSLLVWLLSLGAFVLSFRGERRGQGRAPHFPRALSGLMPLAVGASLAIWSWPLLGPWMSTSLGVSAALLGMLMHGRIYAWLRRPRADLGARYPFTSEHALAGPGGHVWSRLPGSGLRFRMLQAARPRSSQAQGCTWVFEDGHLLEGRDQSLHVSRDGRWMVVRALRGEGVVALDRRSSRRYEWKDGAALWQAIEASTRWPRTLEGWRERADRDELLVLRFGLWMTEATFQSAAPELIEIPDPLGRPRLRFLAQRSPQQVAEAAHPLQYALHPRYLAEFDRQALPFPVRSPEHAVWRADGRAVLLPADDGAGLWLHEDGHASRRLQPRWNAEHGHPAVGLGRVRVLEAERIGVELRQGQVGGSYPQQWDAVGTEAGLRFSTGLAWASALPDGAVRYEQRELPGDCLLWLRLDDLDDHSCSAEVESLGPGGHVALFRRQADRCWRCLLDGQLLPPSPLALQHLWSDDGGHLVLMPSVAVGAVADTCMLVDTARRELVASEVRGFDLRPLGMFDGVLQVRHVLGRVNAPGEALKQAHPSADRGQAFLQPRRSSWLRLRCDRYQLDARGEALLGPLPRLARVRIAPSPLAAFDLLYTGPAGTWAYVEGARGRNDEAQPRPQDARFDARVCVRGGLACVGMSPAMLWSADGRFLLLAHAPDPAQPSWVPWLLDLAESSLHRPFDEDAARSSLPGMPFFIGLHAGVVRYEWCETPWWVPGHPRRQASLAIEALLARYERVELASVEGLKVPAEQIGACDWRALARQASRAAG